MTRNSFIKALLLAPFIPLDKLSLLAKEEKPRFTLTVKDRNSGETTMATKEAEWAIGVDPYSKSTHTKGECFILKREELKNGQSKPICVYYSRHKVSVSPGIYKLRK